jgi:hypothetical protein
VRSLSPPTRAAFTVALVSIIFPPLALVAIGLGVATIRRGEILPGLCILVLSMVVAGFWLAVVIAIVNE